MRKSIVYFDHKITMLEKRVTPFRHISSILSLSLPGLSTPITQQSPENRVSANNGARFSFFQRRFGAPTNTYVSGSPTGGCRKNR